MPTNDDPLVLLHGLGGNREVWTEMREFLGDREIIAPDLPGHGSAPAPGRYTFASMAQAVAVDLDRSRRYEVLGHSLGGVVALALADPSLGLDLSRVVGLSIKASWSAEDIARAEALGAKPPAVFDTREEAVERFLKVAGLFGLVDPGSPVVTAGVREEGGRWRTTVDPATTAAGAPDMPALLAAATCPVVLARGEHDTISTEAALTALDTLLPAPHVTLPGLGHNPHVEYPPAVAALL